MHARRRGSHGSKKPFVKEKPDWVQIEPDEVEELVVRLANAGNSAAKIGLILRDAYGVPSVRLVTGKAIGVILAEKKLQGKLPDDLRDLMKRAVMLEDHIKRNPRDTHNRRGLALIESKIRRLVKYYGREGRLTAGWKYSLETAKLEIE